MKCFLKRFLGLDYSRRGIVMKQFMDPYGILSINASSNLQVTSSINVEKKICKTMQYDKDELKLDFEQVILQSSALKFEDPFEILYQKIIES